jgi:hypothetical protein
LRQKSSGRLLSPFLSLSNTNKADVTVSVLTYRSTYWLEVGSSTMMKVVKKTARAPLHG